MSLPLTLVAFAVAELNVQYLCQDSFYNRLTPEQSKVAFENKYDFDHPNAIDLQLFAEAGSRFCSSLVVELIFGNEIVPSGSQSLQADQRAKVFFHEASARR